MQQIASEKREEKKGKIDLVNWIQKIGIDDKISKYNLNPIVVAVFGGIINYPKISFLLRKGMEVGYKTDLEKFGFKETEPNIFDLRDWDENSQMGNGCGKKRSKIAEDN